MMKLELIFFVAIVATVIFCVANSEEIVELDDIDPNLEAELLPLAREYAKLNKALEKELGETTNNVKCVKVAKELLKDASPGCIGSACSTQNNWTKALKLFIAMEGTSGKCDTASYETLMENYIITEKAIKDGDDVGRVRYALDVYRYARFVNCRAVHWHRFAHRVESIPNGVVKKLATNFHSMDVPRLIPAGSQEQFYGADYKDLVGMPLPKFSQSEEGQRELARKVMSQATKDLHVALITSHSAQLDSRALKVLFDDYIFTPCKLYREELGTLLNEARFDATYNFDVEAQDDFIRGDEKFNRALIFNRLCGSLLREQNSLYEPLGRAWKEVLGEP